MFKLKEMIDTVNMAIATKMEKREVLLSWNP